MKKFLIVTLVFLGVSLSFMAKETGKDPQNQQAPVKTRTWQVKSVDTMKYSRDLAAEKLNDPTFDTTIETQVKSIAELGATHVAIGTPYDEKFIPYLSRWVQAARANNLKVWFRGNFSGWEGWFGYKKSLTSSEHLALMQEFINQNGSLFENGDLFTPCPECEHGGPGDPRHSGDVNGFRQFMIEEFQTANLEFRKIGKNVRTVNSMNFDVASLVMDEPTANATGDLVVIDHYVKDPQKLSNDVNILSQKTKSKIVLGEFGAPIPDIHGNLTEEKQAQWVEESLSLIKNQPELIGINYWVSHGGSTAIFTKNSPTKAAAVLKTYFNLANLD